MNAAEERALLELFATVDGVFTETDAFERHNISLGRIYRQWQQTRDVLARQSHVPLRQRIPRTKSDGG